MNFFNTKLKKTVCTLLSVSVLTAGAFALTEEEPISPQTLEPILVYGQIAQLEENQVNLKIEDEQLAYENIVLNLSEDTILVGPEGETEPSFEAMEVGQNVYAYISPAMTRSIPPQSSAYIVYYGVDEGFEVPAYTTQAAVENVPASQEPEREFDLNQWNRLQPIRVSGSVSELDETTIFLTGSDSPASRDIILNVGEQTMILDAQTGEAVSKDSIKAGDTITVWTSPAMTLSLPPQSSALVILCNAPEGYTVPIYAEIEQVNMADNGNVSLLTADDIIYSLSAETELTFVEAFADSSIQDIRPGDKVLAWYEMVMESFPAQAVPTKLVVLPYDYSGYIAAETSDSVTLNGEALSVAPYVQDGILMLPLRALAEALGCQVEWKRGEPDTVTVSKDGETLYTISLETDQIEAASQAFESLSAVATVIEGVSYVPADDLIYLHGLKLQGLWPVI